MDGDRRAADGLVPQVQPLRRAEAFVSDRDAISSLCDQLGTGPFALITIFACPEADLAELALALRRSAESACVIGCSTAGEIGQEGYAEGKIVAVGFPATLFEAHCLLLTEISRTDQSDLTQDVLALRSTMECSPRATEMPNSFGLMLTDGLSLREDMLATCVAAALGGIPMFGGSAGDGTRFLRTVVMLNGDMREDAAVLALIRSRCAVEVFSLDHFHPTDTRMVVTAADPATRRVMEINAAPAARELARILGKDPEQLSPMTFAAHPLVVRLGGQHHVRAIREVDAGGALVFFSAIDAGLVLSLAEAEDMVAHLDRGLAQLTKPRGPGHPPGQVLACDCILRRLEASERQQAHAVSGVLRRYDVTGFSTYGEQIGPRHVNQTMTGVVLHMPGRSAD